MVDSEQRFKPVVCIADDEEGIRFGLSKLFSRAGYEVLGCATGSEVIHYAKNQHLDALLLDVRLEGSMDGHQVLDEVRRIDSELPVLMITGYGTIESAVEAIKKGAEDYIVKPVDNAKILNKVSSRLERNRAQSEESLESGTCEESSAADSLVAVSPPMQQLLDLVSRIKEQDISVLLTGESGVGKELLARYIHERSPRADEPFIGVNCAAFSETLLLSELFGHERGAFTGADRRKLGCFERAGKGTLFLDEIGDMAPDTQAKLLRVLETRRFERLGGSESVTVEARIIAATNQDLEELVRNGSFREDLYYRINVVRMQIPPLRERSEDLRRMIELFLAVFNEKYGRLVTEIPGSVMRELLAYRWPGNARELKNVMSQSVLLSSSSRLELFGLPAATGAAPIPSGRPEDAEKVGVYHSQMSAATEGVGRQLVISALRQSNGNKSAAARILGITRKTLQRKIARFNIDPDAITG